MDHRLSNGKVISLPKDAVFKCDHAVGLDWLRKYNGNGDGDGEGKMKELADCTPDELYAELDKIGVEKARLGRRRDQYTDHTRQYLKARQKQVKAELRGRGLRAGKPGSRKVLPTAAHLAARGREMREAAA